MPVRLALHPLRSTFTALALGTLPLPAASLLLSYELQTGSAAIAPFNIPNPQGGTDLTITPSLTLNSGSFDILFESESGIAGGYGSPARVSSLSFTGSITITVATVVNTGFFSLPVQADLNGPLSGNQLSDSTGTASILGGDVIYADTNPGNFDVTAGPLTCTGGLFGLVCALLEAGLGLDFPLTIPAATNAPIPFVGTFRDLDSPGASTAASSFDFSVPLDDTATFGATINFTWSETERVVIPVPEPSLLLLLTCPLLLLAPRRRPHPPA